MSTRKGSEEGRVLAALGVPRSAIPAILADPDCRPIIDTFMGALREAARDLNAYLEEMRGG